MNNDIEVKSENTSVPKKEAEKPENLIVAAMVTVKEKVKKLIPHLLIAALLVAVGFAFYFWNEVSALKDNPQKTAQEETSKLINAISELILLPDEVPTIATVADPEKLRDQLFFIKAQKDDRVLIYTENRKAILYRPSEHKIIEVAPIVNVESPVDQVNVDSPVDQEVSP